MDVMLAFVRPALDWHALAPELTLLAVGTLVTVADIAFDDKVRRLMPTLAGVGLLATLIPILTLATDGAERPMFDGAYVVDDFSLVLKALFVLAGYIVVLMSVDYVRDGDYYENEYYTLLLTSLLGMVMMASSRDLVSVFVALELLSIPAYMLAAWRKGGPRSNEAGLKYYLMGVFASAVMLYGMSLLFGVTGGTDFGTIAAGLSGDSSPLVIVAVLFVLIGFAFKVSAVPFHTWAPDTYEGAPTPVTAFLSVASKSAGMVALLGLVFVAFEGAADVVQPFFWVLAAVTMTVGNLIALRQTNIVRMLAYSGIAQGGFMLVPFAVAFEGSSATLASAREAVVVYMIIYAFMNLGAFSVVLAVSRRTRSGAITSYGGLFSYAPGLTVLMTLFLASLAGIPPAGGWFAKFVVFRTLADASTPAGWVLAALVAVNAVIAFGYYARVLMQMWFQPVPETVEVGIDASADEPADLESAGAELEPAAAQDGAGVTVETRERRTLLVPFVPGPIPMTGALAAALVITALATLVTGIFPGLVSHFGDVSTFSIGG
ncbi:NADH-quinone oxidoreductase subunit N [Candidatus Poriferisodalis sp.]|uniref:NADH-quinone oxidoreductase subunit N n=1 Tax=Candidatus Poriferisodalis sp. TaxID=3101277 RepID=UPI003B020C48